jgi:hypothetical protein
MRISISGYLTQSKLSETIKSIVGESWLGDEIRVPGFRYRWDMAFRRPSGAAVVEYDGDAHYRDTIKMKTDAEKEAIAKELGYVTIRFPYWIQLDSITLKHFFQLEAQVETDFPHGFVTTRIFPASFCEMGVQRFSTELESLPTIVRAAVLDSLRDRATDFGIDYVMPLSLRHLIA